MGTATCRISLQHREAFEETAGRSWNDGDGCNFHSYAVPLGILRTIEA